MAPLLAPSVPCRGGLPAAWPAPLPGSPSQWPLSRYPPLPTRGPLQSVSYMITPMSPGSLPEQVGTAPSPGA